ncbi:MAG: DUF4400 domain-containing protein [Burkholderiaceae bacterium]|jgi:hypothetical protein|nr:MAG: DUF4400 domain-containing protein [Burkholderiaceae bacterium]
MIRAVSVVALLCLLVLVLYLPSAHPPDRFVELVRQEQQAIGRFWGDSTSMRILSRALTTADSAQRASPVPQLSAAPSSNSVSGAVSIEMASVNQRLFNSAYFRSIDALLLLAAFRLSTLIEWLPWLLAFSAAAVIDGFVVRQVKAKEFRQHDPEWFAAHASLGIVTICMTVIGFVLPLALHPLVMPGAPVLLSVFLGRTISSFHLRA